MKCLRTLLPLLCAWPVGVALAATNTTGDTTTGTASLETIVVTAHRLPTTTPVLPVHTRELNDVPTVGVQALRDLPSFAISQSGSLGSLTQVRVRGAEANHLLVLVDGVEVMDPTTDAGFNFANLNLAGISRLEYLPGAQSAIWGNHALAGVLQLSTEPAARARRVDLEAGSFDSQQASLQLADTTDDHYYNFSISDFSTDGTNIARQGSERDGYDNHAWLLSAGLNRETWSLRGLTRRTRTRSDFDPTPFPAFLPVDGDRQNQHDETLTLVGLDLRGTAIPWQERLTLSLFETGNSTNTDGLRTATTNGRRWKLSSVTAVPLGSRQHLELLLEHQQESFNQRGEATPFGDPNQRQKVRTSSAGLEYVLLPAEHWRLSASGRYDRNSEFENSESLRLAASYAWSDDTLLWIALGTGIKLPSFVERFGFTPDSFIGNPGLEAESNRHVSVGATHQRRTWVHDLTLFRDRLENEINGFAFDPVRGGFTALNEDGTSRRQGIEWASTRPWSSGALRLGANYLHAEESDGSREIRRPQWHAFASIDQQWQRMVLSIGAFHVDEQIDLDFASWPARRETLDAYTLIHAQLRLPIGERVDVSLRAANLLDETYEDLLGYRAPGRAYYFNIGVDF